MYLLIQCQFLSVFSTGSQIRVDDAKLLQQGSEDGEGAEEDPSVKVTAGRTGIDWMRIEVHWEIRGLISFSSLVHPVAVEDGRSGKVADSS